MSDAELRKELQKLGYSPGPITDSTREVLRNKLKRLRVDSTKRQSQTISKQGQGTRKSGGSSISRISKPLEDKGRKWEDEDEDEEEEKSFSHFSSQRNQQVETNNYGGGSRSDRTDECSYCDRKGVPSPLYVRDKVTSGSGLSSLPTSYLNSAYQREEAGSCLGRESCSRTTSHYGSLGQESRFSLGGERIPGGTNDYRRDESRSTYGPLGQESRSSLGGERIPGGTNDYRRDESRSTYGPLGQESRFSLGGERIPGGTNDYRRDEARSTYGPLGQESRFSLGGERIPGGTNDYRRDEARSTYGPLGQGSRSSLGGERNSGSTDNYRDDSRSTSVYGFLGQGSRSSLGQETRPYLGSERYLLQDLRARSTGEGNSRSSWPTNMTESRHWPKYNERDRLSHRNYPTLNQGQSACSKTNWSKKLEYYLSKLVRALSVGLVIIFLGIFIVKSGILYSTQQNDIKLIPPDCESKTDKYCKTMQKQIILKILSELYNFLSFEAGKFECGNPSGLSSKCIPVKRAKEHVMNVHDHATEKFDTALDWLLDNDEHLGIWAKGQDGEIVTTSSLVVCLESSQPRLGITCRLMNALYTAISNLFLALFGVFVLWLFLIYLRYRWRKLKEEEDQVFDMVDEIIDTVENHHKQYVLGKELNAYIAIVHVRELLVMPKDRKRLQKVWDQAVEFINKDNSLLRLEQQKVAGADHLVWRMVQKRHKNPSKGASLTLST